MTDPALSAALSDARMNFTLAGLAAGDIEFLRDTALDGGRFELAGRISAAMREASKPPVKASKPKADKPPAKKRAAKPAGEAPDSVV